MTKTTFNPKRDLPYLAALAQVVQFVIAGYTLFGWVGCFSGLFLGALVSMTVAYATSQYSDMAKGRKPAAMFFMVVLLSFSPIVVGTAAYLELPFTGIWAGIVASAWGILPDFSVALDGFVAGKGMVKQDEKQDEQPPKRNKAEPKQEPVLIEQPAPLFVCSVCNWNTLEAEASGKDARKAYSGHMLKHKPAIVGYEVSMKPVVKDKGA